MSMTHSGAAYPTGFFAVTLVGAALGVLSLSACSAGSGSTTPAGNGGSAQGAGTGSGGVSSAAGGATSSGGAPHGGGPAGGTVGAGGAPAGGASGGASGGTGKPPFDANSADPNRNQVPGNQICERIAAIQCAGEQHCCDAPGRTKDECLSTMTDGCKTQLYLDEVGANSVAGYDEASAAQIFTDYETKAAACDIGVTAWGATVQGLRGLLKGTQTQRCTPPGYPGTIPSNAVAAAYLASCENPGTSACLADTLSWTCKPRGGAGSNCFTDANCTDDPPLGLYCDNPKLVPSPMNKCTTRKADGQTCKLQNECQSLLCKQGTCAALNQQNAFCLKD